MRPGHFMSMALFALFVSIVSAALGQRTMRRRLRYAAWSFLLFMAIAVGVGWLLYPLSR